MKDSEIYQAAIDLLTPEGAWIKYNQGKTADGEPVNTPDPDAVSFCLGGAIMQVTGDEHWMGWYPGFNSVGDRLHDLARTRGYDEKGTPFVSFNNHPGTTQGDVLQLLKEALYDSQAEESKAAIEENLAVPDPFVP